MNARRPLARHEIIDQLVANAAAGIVITAPVRPNTRAQGGPDERGR